MSPPALPCLQAVPHWATDPASEILISSQALKAQEQLLQRGRYGATEAYTGLFIALIKSCRQHALMLCKSDGLRPSCIVCDIPQEHTNHQSSALEQWQNRSTPRIHIRAVQIQQTSAHCRMLNATPFAHPMPTRHFQRSLQHRPGSHRMADIPRHSHLQEERSN